MSIILVVGYLLFIIELNLESPIMERTVRVTEHFVPNSCRFRGGHRDRAGEKKSAALIKRSLASNDHSPFKSSANARAIVSTFKSAQLFLGNVYGASSPKSNMTPTATQRSDVTRNSFSSRLDIKK